VPLVFYGPGWVPAGRVVEQAVESIDILPTVLELSGIAPPPVAQGRSLVPLFQDGAGAAGAASRPVVTEKGLEDDPTSPTAISGVATALELGGWKLVERRAQPADLPILELYETGNDPLDATDVAAANPEKVRELAAALEAWRAETARTKLEIVAPGDTATTPEELERLRSLGYVE
jgi:arylsulfatase A-like enzyme